MPKANNSNKANVKAAQKKEPASDRFLGILGLLILSSAVAIGILGYLPGTSKVVKNETKIKISAEAHELVNSNLGMTDRQLEYQKQSMEIENAEYLRKLNHQEPENTFHLDSTALDFSQDPRQQNLAKDLGRGNIEFSLPRNPEEIIETELFDQDQSRHLSQSYKDTYAKAFIDNARKGGYLIKLNADFKVISVTKIRNPSNEQFDVMQGAVGGNR